MHPILITAGSISGSANSTRSARQVKTCATRRHPSAAFSGPRWSPPLSPQLNTGNALGRDECRLERVNHRWCLNFEDEVSTGSDSDRVTIRETHFLLCGSTRSLPLPVLTPSRHL